MITPAHWALPDGASGDPAFARLHQFWRGKCKNDLLPARTDIDVLEIPRDLLRDIALLEIEPRRRVLTVSLVNTAGTRIYSTELEPAPG